MGREGKLNSRSNDQELQTPTSRRDLAQKNVWLTRSKKNGPVHVKSTYGMESFSHSKRVEARWSEQFQNILNVSGDIEVWKHGGNNKKIMLNIVTNSSPMSGMWIMYHKHGRMPAL